MTREKRILLEVFAMFSDNEKWVDATYEHIKRISNSKVGDVGENFIEKLCTELGFEVVFPTDGNGKKLKQSPWDVKINDIEFELKTASEDVSMAFQFNHIRYHRPYDAVLCLGIAPESMYFNLWSKADIVTGKAGKLVSMEKGANASYKLTKKIVDLHEIDMLQEKLTEFIDNFEK